MLRRWVSRWTRSTWAGEVVVKFLFGDVGEFVGGDGGGGKAGGPHQLGQVALIW